KPSFSGWQHVRLFRFLFRLWVVSQLPFPLNTFGFGIALKIVWQIRAHRFRERHGLRNEILVVPRLAVIIWPPINRGYLPRPIAMDMLHWCGPLQCVGAPRVLGGYLAEPHGGKEIPKEGNLP